MRNNVKRAITFITAGAMLLSVALPARNVQAEELSVTSETAGVTQFMDCFEPMPIVESLSTDCWGAPEVGARDQGNGLEDRKMAAYSYWDGGIVKDDETGKYYMFASRWNQAGGHWGKMGFPDGRGHRPFMRSVTICMDHMRIKVPFGRIGAKVPDIMSFRLHSAKMIHCTIMGIGMPFQSAIPV